MALSGYHTVLVVGDDYKEILYPYSLEKKVDKYIKYRRKDAGKLRKNTVSLYKAILDNGNLEGVSNEEIKRLYFKYKNMSDFDYYKEITTGCIFDDDSLDAYSIENPDAKFSAYVENFKNNHFSLPFILNDGTETYQAKKGDIDWAKIHMYNTFPYERAWEMVVDGDEPNNEEEQMIYDNMKPRLEYFSNFNSEDEYVSFISGCFREDSNFKEELLRAYECKPDTEFLGFKLRVQEVSCTIAEENSSIFKIKESLSSMVLTFAQNVIDEANREIYEHSEKLKRLNDILDHTELRFKSYRAEVEYEEQLEGRDVDEIGYGEDFATYVQYLVSKGCNISEAVHDTYKLFEYIGATYD